MSVRRDDGLALITVLMTIMMLSLVVTLMLTEAFRQRQQSELAERDDVVLAGTEALLERYASKMSIDPLYYLHWVDEAERTRVCSEFAFTADPGDAWDTSCGTWTYVDPPDDDGDGEPDWFVHPLLEGEVPAARDDVAGLIEVTPPAPGVPLSVQIVGRRGEQVTRRAVDASIEAESIAEFVFLMEQDLRLGQDIVVTGKMYTRGDLIWYGPSFGNTDRDAFAEGSIHGSRFGRRVDDPPVFIDPAHGHTGDGVSWYEPIRDEIPAELDFNTFWDDLSNLQAAACDASGICLDEGATAYKVHPYMDGSGPTVRVWASDESPSQGCLNTEEWWWLDQPSHDAAARWRLIGDFAVPRNGALWADGHIVLGDRYWTGAGDFNRTGDGFSDVVIGESLSIYAGSQLQPRNIVLNADTLYEDPTGAATLALISSDQIVINPLAVGNDYEFYLNASLLTQTTNWFVSLSCGSNSGSNLIPDDPTDPRINSTLYAQGSFASPETAWIYPRFLGRFYDFDPRLEYLRPPHYPLLSGVWNYTNWEETPLPTWAQP